MAGSSLNFFAIRGSIPPTTFASTTVANKLMHTVRETIKSTLSSKYILRKLIKASTKPTNILTLNSFHIILG